MSRLTTRTPLGICGQTAGVENYPLYKVAAEDVLDHGLVGQCFKKLADYEDKEEQGLLLIAPCKVGDKLYQIGKGWYQIGTDITEFMVTAITILKDKIIISVEDENQMGFPVCVDCIGKRLFLTRSEAEEALAKMEEK